MTDRNEALAQLPHKLATLIRSLPQAPFRAHLSAECVKQAERIAELEAEVLEQARLNGMGAERELALMAERDRLRAEVERLRADAERWTALRASNFQMVMHSKGKRVFWSVRPIFTNYEYSLFDSQDQAVDSLRNEQKEQP